MEPNDGRGETTPAQGEKQQRVPRAPHERDESAQSQEGNEASAQDIGQLGHDDVERGVQDTSKQAELGKTYQKQK